MSTPPKRTATARQESTGRDIAPGEAGESTYVRRLPTEIRTGKPRLSAVESEREHDTIPCGPPVVDDPPTRPNDLERTLRFARLVHDMLATDHPLMRMLELAIMRRDGALLRALLKELHKQQTLEVVDDEVGRRSDRHTLLPPPPEQD